MRKKGPTPARAEKVRLSKGLNRGTKLRITRVKRGLSQVELAKVTGIPVQTIQHYEQCPYTIDGTKFSTLCNLCEALNVKISDIIEDTKLIERYNKVK